MFLDSVSYQQTHCHWDLCVKPYVEDQAGPDENVKNNAINLRCGFAVQFDVPREFVTHDTHMIGVLPLPLCVVVNHISFEYGYRCCFIMLIGKTIRGYE